MPQGLLIKLRPTGPWRIGPDSGARDRVGRVYHSDALFAALSQAFAQLGTLEEWLDATARAAAPAVRLSSCFPFQGDTLLVTPPRTLWPPQASSKVRWKGARFVPMNVVAALVQGRGVSEDAWAVDGESECLVPNRTSAPNQTTSGPFRVAVRSSAAVDREGSGVEPHATACLEFTPGSGLWTMVQFADDAAEAKWKERVKAAFRLLCDTGFGGERSRGWGRAEMPEITNWAVTLNAGVEGEAGQWILSLFHPAESDAIDWERSDYSLTTRGGRIESLAGWGEQKKLTRMVSEGSVLAAGALQGSAPDVAPEGFEHPVYRAGFAVALPIPLNGKVSA